MDNYVEIKNIIKDRGFELIDVEIVSCVMSSCETLTDDEFKLVCNYVEAIWQRLDYTYIQLISDIVCDLYKDLEYNFRDRKDGKYLTKTDLKKLNKTSMVLDLFYNHCA